MKVQRHLTLLRERVGDPLNTHRPFIAAETMGVLLILVLWRLSPLPSTVIPFFSLGWLSLWLRRLGWRDVGFRRPQNWLPTTFAGFAMGGLDVIFSKVVVPVLFRAVGETYQPEGLYNLRGNVPVFLALLAFTWPLAAIMEEMVFRGYLLNRLADLFGRSKAGWGASLTLSALMFSLAHDTDGLVPLLATCLGGLFMGGLYLINRRNLWLPIVAHGTGITINVTLAFFGIV